MTETAPRTADEPSPAEAAGTGEAPAVNITALFAEAATKSGLLWVQPPDDRAWPFWHAWADDTVYAVSGPGEQTLPWLPSEVVLLLRSKDTGGRLLTVHATCEEVTPDDERWAAATAALVAARLNATDDLLDRWARECTVRAFKPFGPPLEAPGSFGSASGAAPVPPSTATTTHWRPWHLRGRPRRRRGSPRHDAG
ncbi:hypothetical protein GCM10027517_22360 [Phycicoccus ginsengisoli]